MAELISKGFIGGHAPTRGFFSLSEQDLEAFLSHLEAQVGLSPLIRVKMDLDGDGVFEIIELDRVISIGNLNRSIEYTTGKPSFGSCQITLNNSDKRYSDNYSKAATYFNPASPTRYHYRQVIVEVGFDGLEKHKDENWFQIYMGLIQAKSEDAESQTVTISLIDEWMQIFNYDLGPILSVDTLYSKLSILINGSSSDTRQVQMGTYYGKATFISREFDQQKNQLMIPMIWNNYQVSFYGISGTYEQYFLYAPLMVNSGAAYDYSNASLYFWGWNKSWVGMDDTKQWLKVPASLVTISTSMVAVLTVASTATAIPFVAEDGGTVSISLATYFDSAAQEYSPEVRISADVASTKYYNPSWILYDLLVNNIGINSIAVDSSANNADNWLPGDYDYESASYYSFDTSYRYLEGTALKTAVNINKTTRMIDLINELCQISRGGFFIDSGQDNPGGIPVRRIKFVVHQPRLVAPTIKVLKESRIAQPVLSRDMSEIINKAVITNYDYASSKGYSDTEAYEYEDEDSSAVYGERALNISNKPGAICFIYDSPAYSYFLASHFVMVYREPPIDLSLSTDLIGLNWDLKKLVGIRELENLNIDQTTTDLSGLFEVYSFGFNSASFMINLGLRWAGYLVCPSGDASRRWGFVDYAYTDQDGVGLEYYAW